MSVRVGEGARGCKALLAATRSMDDSLRAWEVVDVGE